MQWQPAACPSVYVCLFLGSHVYCRTHNDDLDNITVLDARTDVAMLEKEACGRVNDQFLASVEYFFWKHSERQLCLTLLSVFRVGLKH